MSRLKGDRNLRTTIDITFDVTCLFVTACLTYFALGKILGLEIGFLQFYK
ncbi:DUF6198 family protein [Butyribacter intestini]